MRRVLAVGVVALLGALVLLPPVEASHQRYVFRYIGGTATGYGVFGIECVPADGDASWYSVGGACRTPCPHGTCDITVTDDKNGEWVFFRIQVNDEPWFRPQAYRHTVSVTGSTIRVAVDFSDATIGTIIIE